MASDDQFSAIESFGKIHLFKTYYKLEDAGMDVIILWCMNHGLITKGYTCPHCKKPMKLSQRSSCKDKFVWVCHYSGEDDPHVKKRSIRIGSWFSRSCMSITKILLATCMWNSKIPARVLGEQVGLATPTVTDWCTFCREVVFEAMLQNTCEIGGKGTMIAMIESNFENHQYKKGKFKQGKFLICGIEKGSENCFVTVIEDHSCEVLVNVLKKYVLPDTTILSDNWDAYGGISNLTSQCKKLNHKLIFIDPSTATLSNFLKGLWSAIERSLPATRLVDDGYYFYLVEYLWRKKYKQSEERMNNLFDCIRTIYVPRTEDDPSAPVKENNSKKGQKSSKRKIEDDDDVCALYDEPSTSY